VYVSLVHPSAYGPSAGWEGTCRPLSACAADKTEKWSTFAPCNIKGSNFNIIIFIIINIIKKIITKLKKFLILKKIKI